MTSITVQQLTVGPLATHCYILHDPQRHEALVIDPGAEAERISATISGRVTAILLTHAHFDHIHGVNALAEATGAPVWLHPADAHMLGLTRVDHWITPGQQWRLGDLWLTAQPTPGHTPGMVSFVGAEVAFVGDTIFAGGPGRTWCPPDFQTTLHTLREVVLRWPDALICHPGHGPSFRLGAIRAQIEAFVHRAWPADFYGDAEWPRA
ncbi:MBL fold metallo-hydrolase [Kallotenue papyrolyticum]|uniref:MBL fold metallo-hydrolase n=1 Tax=Kallotenue papyrolyticum TaxID=1325125 RepID=UPI0004B7C558|nr:MBL fold metallo-hydrolase [Kallotenue papyrolyticum]